MRAQVRFAHSQEIVYNARVMTSQASSRPFMGLKLQPRQGVAAGFLAGAGMLLAWLGAMNLWGPGPRALLIGIGQAFLPGADSASQTVAGVLVHFLLAIGLGVLYAASLDRLNARDTMVVSIFYGFTLWVVSVLILRHWIHLSVLEQSRSWWGLLVFLIFGALLGVYANWFGLPPEKG